MKGLLKNERCPIHKRRDCCGRQAAKDRPRRNPISGPVTRITDPTWPLGLSATQKRDHRETGGEPDMEENKVAQITKHTDSSRSTDSGVSGTGETMTTEIRKFYLVESGGDGCEATVVCGEAELHRKLAFLYVGDENEQCPQDILKSLADTENWSNHYPDYAPFVWHDRMEDGYVRITVLSEPPAECSRLASRVEELEIVAEDAGMMIRRLLARLPDGMLKTQARDWLKRNQLEGSVLRAGAHAEEKSK